MFLFDNMFKVQFVTLSITYRKMNFFINISILLTIFLLSCKLFSFTLIVFKIHYIQCIIYKFNVNPLFMFVYKTFFDLTIWLGIILKYNIKKVNIQ